MQTTATQAASRGAASDGAPYGQADRADRSGTARLIDVGARLRTWAGFKHLAIWFTVHVFVLLVGIYFFLMGDGFAGFIFVVAGLAILFYGVATIERARREAMRDPPL